MRSNRESARRSRQRKQAQMSELEAQVLPMFYLRSPEHIFCVLFLSNPSCCFIQVDQLRVERSALLKRLTDLNQKFDESAVDNRILKADIETLRARVRHYCLHFHFKVLLFRGCLIYKSSQKLYTSLINNTMEFELIKFQKNCESHG